MAERLTNTLEETPKKGFGLKFCSDRNCNSDEDCCNCYAFNQTINKLRQFEDIIGKYGIESVEELDNVLGKYFSDTWITVTPKIAENLKLIFDIIASDELNRNFELGITRNRDTWKRACELACAFLSKLTQDNICDYEEDFYQQTKTEGNDEK